MLAGQGDRARLDRGRPLGAAPNLVDGFDSRTRRPADSDAVARARHDLLYRQIQAREPADRLAEALVDPSLRAERDAAAAELAEIDAQHQMLCRQARWSTPCCRTRRGRSPSCAGATSSSPASRSARDACRASPVCRPTFSLADPDDEGSRRAALADWLASPRNMLTWRSIANRVWHYHFGRGIVETPNDFGRNGAQPTHPELLDWLAVELRDRRPVAQGPPPSDRHERRLSPVVARQPGLAAIDADNRYLWRQNRRRLDAEAIRDSVLAVSGTLDRRMGGPGFELFRFKDDHSPIYDHTDPAKVDNPQVPPADRLSLHRAERPEPVHGGARLRRPEPQHAGAQPDADGDSRRWRSGTTCSWCGSRTTSPGGSRRLADDPRARIAAAYRLALGREPRARRARRPGRLRRASTAWPTPAGCFATPTSSSSSTELESWHERNATRMPYDARQTTDCGELGARSTAAAFCSEPAAVSAPWRWRTCWATESLLADATGRVNRPSPGPSGTADCTTAPRPGGSFSSSCRAPPASATRSTTSRS